LLFIFLRRRKLADYGIQFRDLKYQLDIALTYLFPVALVYVPIGMGVDYTAWSDSIPLAVIEAGLLLVVALILRKKTPTSVAGAATALVLLSPAVSSGDQVTVGKVIVTFLFYALFVGFGEEILFRGYMQSRLNEVFANRTGSSKCPSIGVPSLQPCYSA